MKTSGRRKLLMRVGAACLLVAAVLFACVGAFTSARADEVDADAVAALERCAEYLDGHAFSSRSDGFINTRVFGIPCKQSLTSIREVNGKNYHAVDESKSAFVSVAFDRVSDGETHSVRTAEYKKKKFVYGEPVVYTRDEYVSLFGEPPLGLTKFDFAGNVTGARRVDDKTFVYTLEPTRASARCVNLIKTIASAKAAQYRYIELTLVTDGEKPLELKSVEKFDIEKLGGLKCTAEFMEIFEY